jgi:hypothetical protein
MRVLSSGPCLTSSHDKNQLGDAWSLNIFHAQRAAIVPEEAAFFLQSQVGSPPRLGSEGLPYPEDLVAQQQIIKAVFDGNLSARGLSFRRSSYFSLLSSSLFLSFLPSLSSLALPSSRRFLQEAFPKTLHTSDAQSDHLPQMDPPQDEAHPPDCGCTSAADRLTPLRLPNTQRREESARTTKTRPTRSVSGSDSEIRTAGRRRRG